MQVTKLPTKAREVALDKLRQQQYPQNEYATSWEWRGHRFVFEPDACSEPSLDEETHAKFTKFVNRITIVAFWTLGITLFTGFVAIVITVLRNSGKL